MRIVSCRPGINNSVNRFGNGYFHTIEFEWCPIAVLALCVSCAPLMTIGIIHLSSCFLAQICLTGLIPVIIRTRCVYRTNSVLVQVLTFGSLHSLPVLSLAQVLSFPFGQFP